MKTARRSVNGFITALLTIAACLGGVSAVLATFNAICRKFLTLSFPWAEELCTYMVVIAVFLAIPYLELKDKQLCIDILSNGIKNKHIKRALFVLRGVIVIFLCVVIVRYGLASTVSAHQTNTLTYVLQWPRAIFFGIGVLSFAIAILAWLASIFLNGEGTSDDA